MRASASFCFSARSLVRLRPSAVGAAEEASERADGRVLEEHRDRDVRPHLVANPPVRPQQQERMASEIEEVVVHADPLDLEEVAPDRGDGLLHLPHGRHEGSRRRLAAPGCDLGGFPTRLRGEPREDVGDRRVRLARDEREHGSKVARHGGSLLGRHAIAVHEHLEPQLGRRDDHERDRVVRRIGAEEQLDLDVVAERGCVVDGVVLEDDQAVEEPSVGRQLGPDLDVPE